ncbi:hypothetical protein K493DRAFT_5815 [Basidiobolus meristosporus CBS 931.73]|uniref:SprT-like domain-containing protein n=1 Tax=Basidiobolus meristosporus CBS 931.73 TaxID=1314790 RepID=A0A1Y1W2E7_9FUNG|nr:hypothetical protein K493DRAFT_5815 [Basidiobolus meristosporus CBS 931.73]|eukprot:ORX67721.1 hypothetical protein K493DRAFT_5815 [Basidiobolus meristosporus CBS 931.73]
MHHIYCDRSSLHGAIVKMGSPSIQITPKLFQEKPTDQPTPNEPSPFNLSDDEFWEEWGQTVQVNPALPNQQEGPESGLQKRQLQLKERPFPFNKIFTETPPYHPYDEQQGTPSPLYPNTPENPEFTPLGPTYSTNSNPFNTSDSTFAFTPNQNPNESPCDTNQEEFWREWAEEFKTPPSTINHPTRTAENSLGRVFTPEEIDLTNSPTATPSPDLKKASLDSPDSANLPSLAFVTVRRTGRRDRRFQLRNSTPGSPLNPNNRKADNRSNIHSVADRFSAIQLDSEEEGEVGKESSPPRGNKPEGPTEMDDEESLSEAFYTPAPRGRRRMVILSDEESDGEEEAAAESPLPEIRPETETESEESEHETLEFNVDSEATMIETNSSLNCTPEKLSEDRVDSPDSLFTVKRRIKPNRLLVVDSDDENSDSETSQPQPPTPPFQSIEVDLNDPEFDGAHNATPDNPPHRDVQSSIFDTPEDIQPPKFTVDSDNEMDGNSETEVSSDDSDLDSGIIVYEGNITNRVIEIKEDDTFWMEPPPTPETPRTPYRTPQPATLIDSSSKTATVRQFKKHREHLTRELFHEYNRKVFDNKLPKEMKITWSVTLKTTAGRAISHRQRRDDEWTYVSRVELSTKVVDNIDRLRNTLAHELCHCAAWIINHIAKPAHGAEFKYWAQQVMKVYPDLNITTCHSYEIAYKYYFECVNPMCKKVYGRHSKSIDPDRHACGVCRSKLREMERLKKDGTPFKKREPNKYQLFIKENFRRVKDANPYATQSQLMSLLSAEYKKKSAQESKAIDELANSIHRIELD